MVFGPCPSGFLLVNRCALPKIANLDVLAGWSILPSKVYYHDFWKVTFFGGNVSRVSDAQAAYSSSELSIGSGAKPDD